MNFNGDCQNKSDEELVRLSLKDTDWYGCLMARYEDKLSRYIYRISGASREDTEDLLQEIFLAAYRNLNDFEQKLKFSSWIYRITHNKVVSHHRQMKARPELVGGEDGEKFLAMVSGGKDLGELVNDQLTGQALQRLFRKIEVRYREALALRYLEEKDYNEISDILKIPLGTVGTLLSRAKVRLRQIIKRENIKL